MKKEQERKRPVAPGDVLEQRRDFCLKALAVEHAMVLDVTEPNELEHLDAAVHRNPMAPIFHELSVQGS